MQLSPIKTFTGNYANTNLFAANNIQDRMEPVPESGVIRYFFVPPVRANNETIHKAEIVKDGGFEILNVYTGTGQMELTTDNIYTCAFSNDGKTFVKEVKGSRDFNQSEYVDLMSCVVNRIRLLDKSRAAKLNKFMNIINNPSPCQNAAGKTIPLRRVFVSNHDPASGNKVISYLTVMPDGTLKTSKLYIAKKADKNRIVFEMKMADDDKTFCYILNKNGNGLECEKIYFYGIKQIIDDKYKITPEEKHLIMTNLKNIIAYEHNPEYIEILKTIFDGTSLLKAV